MAVIENLQIIEGKDNPGLQLWQNTQFKLHTIWRNGETWWLVLDLYRPLQYSAVQNAVKGLDADEVAEYAISILSSNGTRQQRKMVFVNEAGLYAILFKSRKPYAKPLRKWITSEVLPGLRRDGHYRMTAVNPVTVKEVEADIERSKLCVQRSREHLWRIQNVEGNTSLRAFLLAVDLKIPQPTWMALATRLRWRCRKLGHPVGRIRVRRMKYENGEPIRSNGAVPVATYAPQDIAIELTALGHPCVPPEPAKLALAEQTLLVPGDKGFDERKSLYA